MPCSIAAWCAKKKKKEEGREPQPRLLIWGISFMPGAGQEQMDSTPRRHGTMAAAADQDFLGRPFLFRSPLVSFSHLVSCSLLTSPTYLFSRTARLLIMCVRDRWGGRDRRWKGLLRRSICALPTPTPCPLASLPYPHPPPLSCLLPPLPQETCLPYLPTDFALPSQHSSLTFPFHTPLPHAHSHCFALPLAFGTVWAFLSGVWCVWEEQEWRTWTREDGMSLPGQAFA